MFTRRAFLSSATGGLACLLGQWSRAAAAAEAGGNAALAPTVSLSGGAREVGRRFGALNREDIRQHMNDMLDGWRARGLSDKQMLERSEPFRRFVAKFAPFWQDEMAGCAEGADVNLDLFASFQAGKYRGLFFVDECTSFLAVGAATEDGATLFHKNRDNVARPQCAYHKCIVDAARPAAFHATGDTSDLGVMMMVNEHGLAGSADTGGLREDRPKGRGVMNPHILRLIAERAERCEDALEIVQQMIRDGWYAGGAKTGTHWLFADRHGRGLRIAQNAHEERHEFFQDDVAFLARGRTAGADLVRGKKGRITLRDFNAAASHPTICFTSSISALSVRVDPECPGKLSSVWFALPAWAPYVPLFPLARGVPRALLDGTSFRAAQVLLELRSRSAPGQGVAFEGSLVQRHAAVQDALYREAEAFERAIRHARKRQHEDEAADLATDGAAAACARLLEFLGGLQQPQAGQGARPAGSRRERCPARNQPT
jgi:uncharacterized protein YukE